MNLIIGSSQHRCGTLSKQSFLPPPNHVMFLPLHYADMSTHKSGQLILNIFFWAGLVLITSSSLIQYATGQIIHKKKYIEKASSDSILITVGWIANHIPKDLHYHNWGDSKPQKAGEKFCSTLKKINIHGPLTSLHCLLYLSFLLWKTLELIRKNYTNSASWRTIEMNESRI